MSTWKAAQLDRLKPLVFLLGLFPLGRWVWLGFNNGLSANPAEFLTRSSGIWALVLLLLTLALSPVRRLLAQPALVRWRRMLGLFSFFYAALHTLAWAWWDRSGDWLSMWQDVMQRPLITIGVVAVLILLALTLTSTHGWQKRLGRGWSRLHQTVYLAAVLSILHFYLIRTGKNDVVEVYVYGLVLVGLLVLRRWPVLNKTAR